ncbi:MAG: nickel-type superoxide dismutase maturation protease [Hellea sp.]
MLRLVKITGQSMSPTLNDGDYVITKKPRLYQAGLIYVINHIDLGRIIKRLQSTKHDRCYFIGDNPKASTPSSLIGAVERERVIGQVIYVIGPKGLRRP